MLARMWSNRNCHSLLVKVWNSAATLEDSLEVSCKTKHTRRGLQYSPAIVFFGTCPQTAESLYLHTKLPIGVYSSFTHNSPTRKQPRLPRVGGWIHKLWCIQTVGYYSALKGNEPSSHEKTRRNCTFSLGERSQSEKTTDCMIPTTWLSGKGKSMETINRSMASKGWAWWRNEQAQNKEFLGQKISTSLSMLLRM